VEEGGVEAGGEDAGGEVEAFAGLALVGEEGVVEVADLLEEGEAEPLPELFVAVRVEGGLVDGGEDEEGVAETGELEFFVGEEAGDGGELLPGAGEGHGVKGGELLGGPLGEVADALLGAEADAEDGDARGGEEGVLQRREVRRGEGFFLAVEGVTQELEGETHGVREVVGGRAENSQEWGFGLFGFARGEGGGCGAWCWFEAWARRTSGGGASGIWDGADLGAGEYDICQLGGLNGVYRLGLCVDRAWFGHLADWGGVGVYFDRFAGYGVGPRGGCCGCVIQDLVGWFVCLQ